MIGAKLICRARGHDWPRVSWDTHTIGDEVHCGRCGETTVVRCEGCGGQVTLPEHKSVYFPKTDSEGRTMFYGMLLPTPCTRGLGRAEMFDPLKNAEAALRYVRDRHPTPGLWETAEGHYDHHKPGEPLA